MAGIMLLSSAATACADLYRWIDPESGSVKITSSPPLWYGEGAKTHSGPVVEVIRSPFSQPVAPAAREPRPARTAQAPGAEKAEIPKPAAASEAPAAKGGLLEMLAAKRKELLRIFEAFPKATDFQSAGEGFGNHLQAYEAVSAELDRLDPKRAAARRAEDPGFMARFRDGMRFQFSASPTLPSEQQPKK